MPSSLLRAFVIRCNSVIIRHNCSLNVNLPLSLSSLRSRSASFLVFSLVRGPRCRSRRPSSLDHRHQFRLRDLINQHHLEVYAEPPPDPPNDYDFIVFVQSSGFPPRSSPISLAKALIAQKLYRLQICPLSQLPEPTPPSSPPHLQIHPTIAVVFLQRSPSPLSCALLHYYCSFSVLLSLSPGPEERQKKKRRTRKRWR